MSDFVEEEELDLPSSRLHNSGYGRPPEIYRTPALGMGLRIDPRAWALAWPRNDKSRRVVAQLIEVLTGDCSGIPDTDAKQIAMLRDIVVAKGWTEGVTLLGTHSGRKMMERYEPKAPVTDRDLALACVASASMHVPVAIWDAQPCWNESRRDKIVRVRWLQRQNASPVAREAWESLRALSGDVP